MTTVQVIPPSMHELIVPAANAAGYARRPSMIEYSRGVAYEKDGNISRPIVGVTRAEARELAKSVGCSISTAVHEQVLSERGYNDEAFDGILRREHSKFVGYWNWTDTGLLKPRGSVSDYTKTKGGKTYWLRIVTEGDKEVGELWVPEGSRKMVVREWSVFGLPTETSDDDFGRTDETTFEFNPHVHEISVVRDGDSIPGTFRIVACNGPSDFIKYGGFRLIRVPEAVYEKLPSAEQ